jgi:putative transposase
VTYRFIDAEKPHHAVATMCRTLRVSRSGFYAWCQRGISDHAASDVALAAQVAAIHRMSDGTYGVPRVHAELRAQQIRVSRRRVARLMREQGLAGVSRRRRRSLTTPAKERPACPDLVKRRFGQASAPDEVWYADITYVPTWEGWLYVALVVDAFSRRIVGWSMRDTLEAEIVVDALGMAATRRRPRAGTIHHNDRGGQYASTIFGRTLRETGLVQSMGRRGCALDNAACESAIASFKCELVHRRSFRSRDGARGECFTWIEGWYNARRRHSSLGYLSPADFEAAYHDRADADALSGDLRPAPDEAHVLIPPAPGPFGAADPVQPALEGSAGRGRNSTDESREVSAEVR